MERAPNHAAILSIGTELTRGEIINTNQSWLAGQLTELGLTVTCSETVPDIPSQIAQSLKRLTEAHRFILCTGGLGPTTDDLTSQSVAELLGVPLVRDADSLLKIEQRMAQAGREMAASNARQADFPRGAQVLPNSVGTAPGFAVGIGEATAFFMPGVPKEMYLMFQHQIIPHIKQFIPEPSEHQAKLKVFGIAESTTGDLLQGIEASYGVSIGYRAHFPEIEVKLLAKRSSKLEAERAAEAAASAAAEKIGRFVYHQGDATLPEVLAELLNERELHVVCAESCTGGLVSQLLTEIPGSSSYFNCSAITYTNQSKQLLLGVGSALLEEYGAVSEPVARAMASGALEKLGGDFAIALTGIAGPGGGSLEKPVGLVHYAIAQRDGSGKSRDGSALELLKHPKYLFEDQDSAILNARVRTTAHHRVFRGDRGQVRLAAAWSALALLRELLVSEG